MERKITADFSSIDLADYALNDVSGRFSDVRYAKLSYKKQKHSDDFAVLPAFPPTEMQNGVSQSGSAPFAYPLIGAFGAEEPTNSREYASIEIHATDENLKNICDTLHHDGGVNVRTS